MQIKQNALKAGDVNIVKQYLKGHTINKMMYNDEAVFQFIDKPVLYTDTTSVEAPYSGGSVVVMVSSNCPSWTVTSPDWITAPTGGSYSQSLTLQFASTTEEHSGSVVISADGVKPVTIAVHQAPAFISADTTSITVQGDGGVVTVNVTSNISSWTVTVPSFVSASTLSGSYSQSVDFSIGESEEDRSGEIIISNSELEKSFNIEVNQINIPLSNQFWYTSTDGNVVTPYSTTPFNANIISNTYSGGKGVITCDAPITIINNDAFRECSTLETIWMGNAVTMINDDAFEVCTALTAITLSEALTYLQARVFNASCSLLKEIVIPDSVTGTSLYVFSACSLDKLVIGSGLTSSNIGTNAFYNVSANTVVTNSVRYRDISGLNTDSVKEIIVGDAVTTLGANAFQGNNVETVVIGRNVTSIGNYAFMSDAKLTSITSLNTTPPSLGSSPWWGVIGNFTIYVPAESVNAYKSAPGWSSQADRIQAIPE